MRKLVISLVLMSAATISAAEVVSAPPWELHSSFWMSLHQMLIADAMRAAPRDLASLSSEERATWSAAVSAYRDAGGDGDMTFARPMIITNDGLTQVADDAAEPSIDAPLAETLKQAAPVYRSHWWAADDRTNRFFISYAAALLRAEGAGLIRLHEAAYRTPWPGRILVYITPHAGPYGAYTMNGRAGGVITTMSSRDSGYQGLRALEMLLHESSHAVVGPRNGTVASAITTGAQKQGFPHPNDLWHAILFATSSELTRRLLAERGVAEYVPSSADMFARVWPKYRAPIEKHWYAYLNGEGTLESAIDKVLAEVRQ